MKIAILLTCFNRIKNTIQCLEQIFASKNLSNIDLQVILVDDGSTDGTGDAVRSQFPQVQVLQGTGSLFWNGGMQLAFNEAINQGADFYIWMNDDTVIFNDAISSTITQIEKLEEQEVLQYILVGSTKDDVTNKHTYGGVQKKRGIHPFKFNLIEPQDTLIECDTINGNFVLIPSLVAKRLGNLDPNYTHAFGDFDYGFRARRQNIPCYILPGYIGTCSNNSSKGTWQDKSLSLKERLKKRHSNTGVPFKNWIYFCRKHGGILWPIWTISPYIKLFLESIKRK